MAVPVVTVTERVKTRNVRKIVWTWTSGSGDDAGEASASNLTELDGEILGLETNPGSTAPTDNYDITITDSDGHDVLIGAGANRDTANTEYVDRASLAGVAGSKLTLNVTNAGDQKEGVVVLWVAN